MYHPRLFIYETINEHILLQAAGKKFKNVQIILNHLFVFDDDVLNMDFYVFRIDSNESKKTWTLTPHYEYLSSTTKPRVTIPLILQSISSFFEVAVLKYTV